MKECLLTEERRVHTKSTYDGGHEGRVEPLQTHVRELGRFAVDSKLGHATASLHACDQTVRHVANRSARQTRCDDLHCSPTAAIATEPQDRAGTAFTAKSREICET